MNLSSTIILDICCGAGTISICLMKRIEKLIKQNKINVQFGCVGIEIIQEAICDAKINAFNNGFNENKYNIYKNHNKKIVLAVNILLVKQNKFLKI